MKKTGVVRVAILVIIGIFSTMMLSGGTVSITWGWKASQDGVLAFRYQLDGEDDSNWAYVDSSILSYTSQELDAAVHHTLFVQQTIDGLTWSPSGYRTYEAIADQDVESQPDEVVPPAVIEEPVAKIEVVAAGPAVVVDEPVEESPVQEPAVTSSVVQPVVPPVRVTSKKATKSIELAAFGAGKLDNYLFTGWFDLAGAYVNMRTMVLPSATLDFITANFKTPEQKTALGLRFGLGYQLYESSGTNVHFGDIHALGSLTFSLSEKVQLDISAGLSGVVVLADISGVSVSAFNVASIDWFYGPVAQVSFRYMLGEAFSLGLTGEARLLFSGLAVPYELTGALRASLGYWF